MLYSSPTLKKNHSVLKLESLWEKSHQWEIFGLRDSWQNPVEMLLPHVAPVKDESNLDGSSHSNPKIVKPMDNPSKKRNVTGCFWTVVERRWAEIFCPVKLTTVHRLRTQDVQKWCDAYKGHNGVILKIKMLPRVKRCFVPRFANTGTLGHVGSAQVSANTDCNMDIIAMLSLSHLNTGRRISNSSLISRSASRWRRSKRAATPSSRGGGRNT